MQKTKFRGLPLWYEHRESTEAMIRQIERFPWFVSPSASRPLIIDCGANIGVSVMEWKTRWPQARIICFEPDPFAFALLERNVGELPGVEPIEAAVADFDGPATLYGESFAGADARGNSIDPAWGDRGGGGAIEVRSERLSAYLREEPVSFLKLDIEGAEQRVLAEAAEYLGTVEAAYVEVHQTDENGDHNSVERIERILAGAGFSIETEARVAEHALPPHLDRWRRQVGARQSQLICRR